MDRTPIDQPQKSEAHETTEDAGASPTSGTSPPRPEDVVQPLPGNELPERSFEDREKTFPEDVRVRRDESDVGGPIVIETDDVDEDHPPLPGSEID